MRLLLIVFALVLTSILQAQERIQMVEYKGVYCIPCVVNGEKVNMIFDTGASVVSISNTLAESMLRDGKLSIRDFDQPQYAILADGSIIESASVNIKSIKIGSKEISNVKAVVINDPSAMLLFGQTAIQKLGEYSIKGDVLTLYSVPKSGQVEFEIWDREIFHYSNRTYGFSWQLPEGVKWERYKGEEKHTVFKVIGGPFEVFVNAQLISHKFDLWEQYEQMQNVLLLTDSIIEKQTGCKVLSSRLEKFIHYGNKGLKRVFVFSDGLNEQRHEVYMLIHNNYNLQATVLINNKAYKQYPDDCQYAINEVFKGFKVY